MRIVKTYDKSFIGNISRKNTEKDLFADGYSIESEEEIKEWDSGSACCLAILFLPLIFFAKTKKTKVTYYKSDVI